MYPGFLMPVCHGLFMILAACPVLSLLFGQSQP